MLRINLINFIKPTFSLSRCHSTTTTAPLKRTFPSLETITATEVTPASKFGQGTYHLTRSSRGNLPVYITYKACNVQYTEVRKIQGDIVQLRNDLQKILRSGSASSGVKDEDFKIRMESKKLVIKGGHKAKIIKALEKVF
ncbi:hypothetical protein WICPIJ_004281 [Wickerhamomyces pijperi]|uniref:Large ribosomal subunit protein mL49 n=1 Tax=Wickerhamomyces pijperi TaxID=599730 RepID=A0A9P8Q7Z7_WICPI|nr:hypothetical protein WICPIJ_004281 [Wickerhamomyces pijperi]